MSTLHKIKIALMASLIWSSTSVSSFAANAVSPSTNESNIIQVPTNLISQSIRDQLSRIPQARNAFGKFDEMWKNPADRQKTLIEYCTTQKDIPAKQCFSFLQVWAMDQQDKSIDSGNFKDFDALDNLMDEAMKMKQSL